MLKQLMYKEWHLALQIPAIVFEFFGCLFLIPAYPFLITFFYGFLGIFFICLSGRENHDVEFTALLPVNRKDQVRARIYMCVSLELLQVAGAALCAALRPFLGMVNNSAGMDANGTLFGCALLLIGLFNLIFFPLYYRNPSKIGAPFLIGSVVYAFGMIGIEILFHIPALQPFGGFDSKFIFARGLILVSGAVVYVVCTFLATRISAARFAKVNLSS